MRSRDASKGANRMSTREDKSSEGARARALHQALSDKGLIPDGFVEGLTHSMETEWVPTNGARLVARAWMDNEFRDLLIEDGTAAAAALGVGGAQGEYTVAVVNTPTLHNVIVCSLCSCTNWPILGLPPEWYKSFEYRSRIIREPREVLREMGTDLSPDVAIRVWDTTAESRYMVLPCRPEGTEDWTEEQLATLVTKDVLIGVAVVTVPASRPVPTSELGELVSSHA